MQVLIVCQAGAGIGLGHLMRALVAARALKTRLGAEVSLLVQGDSIDTALATGFPLDLLPADADLPGEICHLQGRYRNDVVLLDIHPLRVPSGLEATLSSLRITGCMIVAVDAALIRLDSLDLIFIPSFRPPANQPAAPDIPLVFGWDCLLLNVDETTRPWSPGNRVLTLTGGSDATNLGKTWPSLLDEQLPERAELHWVTGPFAPPPVWPNAPRIAIHNHKAPRGLGNLMSSMNYAITIFGVSCYELLHYGIPTVTFSPYGNKDDDELSALAATGAVWIAPDEKRATERLCTLMHDDTQAAELSRRAREQLADTSGRRLAVEIRRLQEMRYG